MELEKIICRCLVNYSSREIQVINKNGIIVIMDNSEFKINIYNERGLI